MTPVTIVGMAAGSIIILAAVAVFLMKKEFPSGGVMVTLLGLVLIGMSQWSSIKLTVAGASIEAVREQIRQTADAVDAVAAQTEETATAVEATKRQLNSALDLLATQGVVPPVSLRPIRAEIMATPPPDLSRLRMARTNLRRVTERQ